MNYENRKKKNYNYKVYGLIIKSDLFMPELLYTEKIKNPDVIINYGIMPEKVKKAIREGKSHLFEKKEAWFDIKGVADYYIRNGNTIIVEPYPDANEQYIKTYILGSAFGMLLIQRNIVAVHGGTIVIGNRAVIFTGDSGTGKSTLTAAFKDKGNFFIADDVSVTGAYKDSNLKIFPGYPQQKLCRDAMIKMGYDINKFTLVDEGRGKYVIPVNKGFYREPLQLGAIFVLTKGEADSIEVNEIRGIEKIKILLDNIYRIEITDYTGIDREYFKKCFEIAKGVPFFSIRRPENKFSVSEQICAIEETLAKINIRSVRFENKEYNMP